MAFAASADRNARQSDINITPLVDVMLVLLVLFIVTAPVATRSLPMDLPQITDAKVLPPDQTLRVYVSAADVYTLDGAPIDRRAMTERFAAVAANAKNPVVEISADPGADYESVLQPMADARRAGLQNLAFVTR